jgi:site-specific DNA-methyltransferase (adenine-specific)
VINIDLQLGDCLHLMNEIPNKSVDMVCCDLPYGATNCKWDTCIDLQELWRHYRRITKPNSAIVLFAQTPFDKVLGVSNLDWLRYEIIWEKTSATGHLNAKKMPLKAHENILIFYRKLPVYNPQKTTGHKPVNNFVKSSDDGECYGKTKKGIKGGGSTERYPRSVQVFPSDKQKVKLHPTQKPLDLIEWLIKTYSKENDMVLDNCMGSGTSGVACQNLGRNFIGIEKDKEIFIGAQERLFEAATRISNRKFLINGEK